VCDVTYILNCKPLCTYVGIRLLVQLRVMLYDWHLVALCIIANLILITSQLIRNISGYIYEEVEWGCINFMAICV
jgi:hypothetical protein